MKKPQVIKVEAPYNYSIAVLGAALYGPHHFAFRPNHSHDDLVEPRTMKGKMTVHDNGDMDFEENRGFAYAKAPFVLPVAEDNIEGWKLKRSTQNYLLQIKLPLWLKEGDMYRRIQRMLPQIMDEIRCDKPWAFVKEREDPSKIA